LGVDDYCVGVFVQWYRGEYRIIDEIFNNGMDLTWYIEQCEERGYNITHYKFPHDIGVRQIITPGASGGRAKSREQILREYFKKNEITAQIVKVPKDSSIANGIEAVRGMIKVLIIDAKCEYIISCFLNYSKEWDDKSLVWKLTPKHDEYSHGSDALRSVAQHTTEIESLHESRRAYARRNGTPSGAAL